LRYIYSGAGRTTDMRTGRQTCRRGNDAARDTISRDAIGTLGGPTPWDPLLVNYISSRNAADRNSTWLSFSRRQANWRLDVHQTMPCGMAFRYPSHHLHYCIAMCVCVCVCVYTRCTARQPASQLTCGSSPLPDFYRPDWPNFLRGSPSRHHCYDQYSTYTLHSLCRVHPRYSVWRSRPHAPLPAPESELQPRQSCRSSTSMDSCRWVRVNARVSPPIRRPLAVFIHRFRPPFCLRRLRLLLVGRRGRASDRTGESQDTEIQANTINMDVFFSMETICFTNVLSSV